MSDKVMTWICLLSAVAGLVCWFIFLFQDTTEHSVLTGFIGMGFGVSFGGSIVRWIKEILE